jgi:hypothetical protein
VCLRQTLNDILYKNVMHRVKTLQLYLEVFQTFYFLPFIPSIIHVLLFIVCHIFPICLPRAKH